MPEQFTRQELYELAWSEPIRDIAARLGLSDVGLAKIYKKANVPVPSRGYWAKQRAGAPTIKIALAPRLPGAPDRIWIGGEPRNWGWGQDWEKTVLETPIPPEPTFDESIESLTARIRKMVGQVPFLRTFQAAFGDVNKLLAQDEKRRASQWSFDKPKYDSGPARRRLLVLHSLFFALRRFGCSTSMRTAQYSSDDDRTIHVKVGEGNVTFTLEELATKSKRTQDTKDAQRFRLAFTTYMATDAQKVHWDDTEDKPLEQQLTDIVVQMLVHGEEMYREGLVRARQSLIDQKERIKEEIRKREEERLRKAREKLEKEQRERLEALLAQAADLQKAAAIRTYVVSMRDRLAELPVTEEEFAIWEAWALGEADRVDPSKSTRFLKLLPNREAPVIENVDTEDYADNLEI